MRRNKRKTLRCSCNSNCGKDNNNNYCDTTTVCLTRHIKYLNVTTKKEESRYEYTCDENGEDSFRKNIIEFRDCMIKTDIEADYSFVLNNSAEYCCDDEDFCNKNLKPVQAEWGQNELNSTTTSDIFRNETNKIAENTLKCNGFFLPVFVNIILIVFLVIAIFGFIFILNANRKLKSKLKNLGSSSRSDIFPLIDTKSVSKI